MASYFHTVPSSTTIRTLIPPPRLQPPLKRDSIVIEPLDDGLEPPCGSLDVAHVGGDAGGVGATDARLVGGGGHAGHILCDAAVEERRRRVHRRQRRRVQRRD